MYDHLVEPDFMKGFQRHAYNLMSTQEKSSCHTVELNCGLKYSRDSSTYQHVADMAAGNTLSLLIVGKEAVGS